MMDLPQPSFQISVIIPVYNHAQYLSEAVASVLCQTLQPHEVLVVDDGSTEAIAPALGKFRDRVKLLRQENQGAGAARNLGIQHATGNFVAFLDADDTWWRNKLEKQAKAFQETPAPDMVYGLVRQFLSPELDEAARQNRFIPNETMTGYVPGTLLLPRSTFLKVGFFDTKVKVGEFIDWYARAKDLGLKEVVLQDIMLHRRIHTQNQGLRAREHSNHYLHVLKSTLDRRKKLAGAD